MNKKLMAIALLVTFNVQATFWDTIKNNPITRNPISSLLVGTGVLYLGGVKSVVSAVDSGASYIWNHKLGTYAALATASTIGMGIGVLAQIGAIDRLIRAMGRLDKIEQAIGSEMADKEKGYVSNVISLGPLIQNKGDNVIRKEIRVSSDNGKTFRRLADELFYKTSSFDSCES